MGRKINSERLRETGESMEEGGGEGEGQNRTEREREGEERDSVREGGDVLSSNRFCHLDRIS